MTLSLAATLYICPQGYCCPESETAGCALDYCVGGRTGRLCGSCRAGSGLVFFDESCRDASDCNDTAWAMSLMAVGAVAMAVFFVTTSVDLTSTSLLAVMLFYYQVRSDWSFGVSVTLSITLPSDTGSVHSEDDAMDTRVERCASRCAEHHDRVCVVVSGRRVVERRVRDP